MSNPRKQVCSILLMLITSICFTHTAIAGGNGKLSVATDPSNASLYIDGQLIGQTPLLKHPLPAGQHTIYLRDQTRQIDYTKIIEIVEDSELVLNVPLQKDYGKLTVTSKPDSSEVYLLTPLGRTPIYDERIEPGTFTFEIRSPDRRYLPLHKNNIYIDQNNPGAISESLPRREIMTTKAWVQIGLGGLSAVSYVWGCVSGINGLNYNYGHPNRSNHPNNFNSYKTQAVLGIVFGTVFLTGLEIVALF